MSSSQLTNICVFQPEGDTANSSITLPTSFITLKNAPGSAQFSQVLQRFIEDKQWKTLEKLRGSAAADVADFLDELITTALNGRSRDRRHMLHILRYLCRSWGVLPASCTLQGKVEFTELPSLAHEDFCELRRGTWRSKEVVIKVMHPGASHWARDVKKELSMGPILGRHLKHRNLLPLYGVCAGVKFTDSGKSTEHPYPCFVVPWMKNGNIRDFLVDVCEGLNYLHSEGFAHGCLDWQSVLVDDEQRACLADFCFRGALGFSEAYFPATTTLDGFSVSGIYMAPERLASPAAPTRKPTDVHELGTLILEVLTFDQSWRDVVEFPITGNLKPPSWVPIPDHPIWDLVKRCWIREPEKRPQMAEILETLTSPGMTFPMVWPLPVTPASPSPPSDSISS